MGCGGGGGGGGAIYGMGVIGALFYFLQRTDTLGEGVVGIIKAIFWPAMVIYQVLGMLKL